LSTRLKTIRIPFATRTTSLATNTTLGTATRYDAAAVTVQMPWTSRTVRHAHVEWGARDVFATAIDFDGVRIGAKINAVAFGDTDTTITVANSGDHTRIEGRTPITSYMTTNDPGTASFTMQIGFAFATSSASNVIGVTGVVVITVEYDDTTSSSVDTQTIAVPIQTHHTTISTSYVEAGTTGGTSNAPANQIPQLTGAGSPLLPESSITVDHYWLDIFGMDLGNGTTTTFSFRVDGATDNNRWANDQTLNSTVGYFDRLDLATAGAGGGALSTTAAHAFEVKGDQTNRADSFGAILYVTYRYDITSATALNSLILPLSNGRSPGVAVTDSTSTDAERYEVVVEIEEPTTITMKQTGVVLHSLTNNVTRSVLTAGQSVRSYAVASSATRDSSASFIHRGDHSSSTWTLARGVNRLTLDVYASAEAISNAHMGGYAIVNYTSGLSLNGRGAHAHSVVHNICGYTEVAAVTRTVISPTAPAIPETVYRPMGVAIDATTYIATLVAFSVDAERQSGEGGGAGWQRATVGLVAAVAQEVGAKRTTVDVTAWWRRNTTYADPDRLNLETSRSWQVWSTSAWQGSVNLITTYHAHSFIVAGTITKDGVPVSPGGAAIVWASDGNGQAERVADSVVGVFGGYAADVPDNTRDYYVIYEDGGDIGVAVGLPGGASSDIDFFTSGPAGGGGGFSMGQLVN
jgi:hypothetical protein